MGRRGLFEQEESIVEGTSLTDIFETQCPIYMSYGMSYEEFWHGDVFAAKYYRNAYLIKVKQKDEELWMQGMYIYEALCKVSPILHAFSKNGTKPLPFSDKPYLYSANVIKTEQDKQKEEENARLIARLHFETWAREMKHKFDKK